MKNEIIYVAKPTGYTERIYPGYTDFYEKFTAQLKQFHEVRALELPDIWVRDFLPVQNQKTGALYQLFFNPRYANYTAAFTARIRQAVQSYFPQALACGVRIDGGNMVINPTREIAFCFEKPSIFCKSRPSEKENAEREIKRASGVEKIVWLPRESGDKIGHIDGFMQFLGNELCVSNERDLSGLSLWKKRDKILRASVGEYIDFPCEAAAKDWLSARGIYVNFLETSQAVFVPQYHLSHDRAVLDIIKRHTAKPILEVDCSQIAKYGGAVHCLTREYFVN